jgi:hypothetical protein
MAAGDWQNGTLPANWMNGMFLDVNFGAKASATRPTTSGWTTSP